MKTFIVHEWYVDGGLRVDQVIVRTSDEVLANKILSTRKYFGHDAWMEVTK